jgi:hypothetical protein
MSDSYLLEQMLADPNAKVIVDIKTDDKSLPLNPPRVVGYLEQDFSFSTQADWTSPYDTFSGMFKFLQNIRNLASTALSALGLDTIAGALPAAMSFTQTIKDYMGSTPPEFDLNLTFIATKNNNQVYPVNSINTLLACTSPTGGGPTNKSSAFFMGEPLGYTHNLTQVTNGFVNLKIGTWLQIPNLLVSAVRPTFSKQVGSQGFPIYSKATIHFEYFRTPSYMEIMSWFTGKFVSDVKGYPPEVKDAQPPTQNVWGQKGGIQGQGELPIL